MLGRDDLTERQLVWQDDDLRFWDGIVCADVRCKEECASRRSASSSRGEDSGECSAECGCRCLICARGLYAWSDKERKTG